MTEKTLSDEIDKMKLNVVSPILKDFIKETLKDIEQTFNYSEKKVELLNRLRERAGEKLT